MKNKGLRIVLITLVLAGVFIVLFIYAPGMPWLLAPIIYLAFYIARKYQLKKKWLKILWMTVGGTFASLSFVVVLILSLPGIGMLIFDFLFAPWLSQLEFPIEHTFVSYSNVSFFGISPDDYGKELAPYTRDDVIFVLTIRGGSYALDSYWDDIADLNMVPAGFRMYIYMKEKHRNSIYRIKKMIFKTAEYTADYKDFNPDGNESINQNDFIKEILPPYISSHTPRDSTEYWWEDTIKGPCVFPFPEDRNFSVDVEMEVDNGETKANYIFTYDYKVRRIKTLDRAWASFVDASHSAAVLARMLGVSSQKAYEVVKW
jgi:hypothetical protein